MLGMLQDQYQKEGTYKAQLGTISLVDIHLQALAFVFLKVLLLALGPRHNLGQQFALLAQEHVGKGGTRYPVALLQVVHQYINLHGFIASEGHEPKNGDNITFSDPIKVNGIHRSRNNDGFTLMCRQDPGYLLHEFHGETSITKPCSIPCKGLKWIKDALGYSGPYSALGSGLAGQCSHCST